MLDQIFDSAVGTAESKAVWFGAAGASVGAAVAVYTTGERVTKK